LRKDDVGRRRPPFRRVLVANRGEIAVRIFRACRELGIETVAVYSDVDADALHAGLADRAEPVGGSTGGGEPYLHVARLIDAARRSGAEAIHPGYGFLSENADFAGAVEEAGLVFIGPPASTLATLGDKLTARRAAADAGVPIVPGLLVPLAGEGQPAASLDLAAVGFPALLKASAGGGGRGMRRVDRPEEVGPAMAVAAREALAAFGDGTLYLERLIAPARHIEVQLLGDLHGQVAVLGERECSVQRRHQKLVEEAPSPAVTEAQRAGLHRDALRLAASVPFSNAATVEFLLDEEGSHFFLEMNTRLQVEHGVTEMVTGLDLVAWQIRVAAGEALPESVLHATSHGHAIEVRIYAEDPHRGFSPAAGEVTAWRMPSGPGVRVDAGIDANTQLPVAYDPLLAKLIVHADTRPTAIARMRRALDETVVGGVQTGLSFFRWLVDQPGFAAGRYDTGLVDELWQSGPELSAEDRALAGLAALQARDDLGRRARGGSGPAPPPAVEGAWATTARREGVSRRLGR
jgi:acetyl/propionyl-CoA carboxylase alpha subunit